MFLAARHDVIKSGRLPYPTCSRGPSSHWLCSHGWCGPHALASQTQPAWCSRGTVLPPRGQSNTLQEAPTQSLMQILSAGPQGITEEMHLWDFEEEMDAVADAHLDIALGEIKFKEILRITCLKSMWVWLRRVALICSVHSFSPWGFSWVPRA